LQGISGNRASSTGSTISGGWWGDLQGGGSGCRRPRRRGRCRRRQGRCQGPEWRGGGCWRASGASATHPSAGRTPPSIPTVSPSPLLRSPLSALSPLSFPRHRSPLPTPPPLPIGLTFAHKR
ncbi:unnamed protein product, partial [Musa acuminata var. zebrina]